MKLHWRCVDFGSLSNLEKNRKNNKKKLVPSISLSHSCVCREWMSSTTYDDARQSSDLWLSGKKLSQKPTGGRKKKEEDGRKRGSHITHIEFPSSFPPWCACVSDILLHILPGTLTSCKWRKGKKKSWKSLFFFYYSFLFFFLYLVDRSRLRDLLRLSISFVFVFSSASRIRYSLDNIRRKHAPTT